MPEEIFYRAYDYATAPSLNEYDEPVGRGEVHVSFREYVVLKRTEKSVLLQQRIGNWSVEGTRWMRLEATNRFASPNHEEALTHFQHRKNAQHRILREQLIDCEQAQSKAKAMLKKMYELKER